MKRILNGILVVEGHGDEAFLSSFIDAVFVVTNGYSINKKDIEFLQSVDGLVPTIILTDSDIAGDQIRNTLNKHISKCENINIEPEYCNKNGKHGVAEASKEIVLEKLNQYFSFEKSINNTLTCSDLYKLGISNNEQRNRLCNSFKLGNCNNKQMIKRLNLKGIKIEDIERAIN